MPSRVIRGEINSSRSLSRVSIEADLTFRALIVAVDDFGRMEADPLMLKAALYPRREAIRPAKVREWVDELAREGCVLLYSVAGVAYLQLAGWETHRGRTNRAKVSRHPSPQDADGPIQEPPGISRDLPESPSESMNMRGDGGAPREPSAATAADTPGGVSSRRKRPGSDPPDSLEGEDWRRLVSRVWKSWPHLVARDESPPAPHCSLAWVRSETTACLDYYRGKGERRADWPATCATWIHKSDERKWEFLRRAPPLRGEYHADPEAFLPDVLKEPNGSQKPLGLDGERVGDALPLTPAEHIARAGAKPSLRLADHRA